MRVTLSAHEQAAIDGYTTVDARLGYTFPNGRWKVMLWGKNITNSYHWNKWW